MKFFFTANDYVNNNFLAFEVSKHSEDYYKLSCLQKDYLPPDFMAMKMQVAYCDEKHEICMNLREYFKKDSMKVYDSAQQLFEDNVDEFL
jgi:hypothetical protein